VTKREKQNTKQGKGPAAPELDPLVGTFPLDMLLGMLGTCKSPFSGLAQQVIPLLEAQGWEPDQSEAAAIYWIAKGEYGKSAKIGAQAVRPFFSAMRYTWHGIRHNAEEQALHDKFKALREAFLQLDDPEAIEPLIALLEVYKHQRDLGARLAVIDLLERIGDERAIEPLNVLAHENEPWLRGRNSPFLIGSHAPRGLLSPAKQTSSQKINPAPPGARTAASNAARRIRERCERKRKGK